MMTPFQESNDTHAAMSVVPVSATIRKRLSFDDMSAVILPLRMSLARQNGCYAHNPVLSDNAFHEKAGRSQVDLFLLDKVFVFLPAESPLSPPFHPHS